MPINHVNTYWCTWWY